LIVNESGVEETVFALWRSSKQLVFTNDIFINSAIGRAFSCERKAAAFGWRVATDTGSQRTNSESKVNNECEKRLHDEFR
jgi:hypothetical protein